MCYLNSRGATRRKRRLVLRRIDGGPAAGTRWRYGANRIIDGVRRCSTRHTGGEFESLTLDHALYGGFAEFNVRDQITLGVYGGEYAIYFPDDRPAFKNAYIGGGGTFYVIPDLALSGLINYRHIYEGRAAIEYSAVVEWLVSKSVPISVFAGYQHRSYTRSGSFHAQLWSFGLKFYTSGNGTTLRDKHRNGALDRLVQPVGQLDIGI